MKKNFSKLLALYLPYLLLGLAATNFGEAWRLAECKEIPAWHGVRFSPVECIILTVNNTFIDAGGYAHEQL